MQGKNTNVIKFVDALKAFKAKLANWKRKAEIYNFAMFEKVDMLLDSREKSSMPKVVEKNIVKHLLNLQNEFDRYFPETGDEELDFVRNPFTFPVEKLSGECQEKFLKLITILELNKSNKKKSLSHFWVELKDSYPQTTETALHIPVPFVSTYLYVSGFLSLLQIKAKHRNTLAVEDDLVVHYHKLHPASNYFQKTNKNKFHIDQEEN